MYISYLVDDYNIYWRVSQGEIYEIKGNATNNENNKDQYWLSEFWQLTESRNDVLVINIQHIKFAAKQM